LLLHLLQGDEEIAGQLKGAAKRRDRGFEQVSPATTSFPGPS